MLQTNNMLIAVDGCVGVGKSTVAKGLAAYRKSQALFESFESNPFLSAFYENPDAYAAETEFTFLCLHFHQLKRFQTIAASDGELITDFHLGKDLLYANLNLKDVKTLDIFRRLCGVFSEQTPKPKILVCLSASTKLILNRIQQRKREIELRIDPGYYARLNAAYEDFFEQYDGRKVRISMDGCDFVRAPSLYRELSESIDELTKGT